MDDLYMRVYSPELPYRLKHLPVFFRDESCLDVIRAVLEEDGTIRNFPGIVRDERWAGKHRLGQCYDVRFEAQFYPIDKGNFLMVWMIQPSGWHWADSDGFGFSGDSIIQLYSVVDGAGNFLHKFQLFSIDQERYCHDFDACLET